MMWWIITIKMSLSNIGCQEGVTATYRMGEKVCEEEIRRIADNSVNGIRFLRNFIENLEEYKTRIGRRIQFRTK